MVDIIPYDPNALSKRGNDKTLFPLPSMSDDGSRLCVRVNIPNIPAHRQAFIGAIYNLTRWYSWSRDEAHTGKQIAAVWRDVFHEMMEHFYDGCDDCPPENSCRDYATDSGVLSYFPVNPFTDPEEIPNQFYNKPPFYVFHGDVLTDITVPSANPLDLPYLAGTELPRIRVTVNGDKLVRLHLLSIIQGGYASVTVDDNPITTNWVDLTRASLLDFQALLNAIQEGLGVGSLTGVLVEDVIVEVKLETVEEHHIDIIFWPKINTEVIIGFGGGLRKVEICGNEMCEDMTFELRQNPENSCLIEQRTAVDGEWTTAFNLGACMPDSDCCDQPPPLYRYTTEYVLERSTDGGETYTPAENYDPRFTAPEFPPAPGDDGDDKKCIAATGAATLFKEQIRDNLSDDITRYDLGELVRDWVTTYTETSNPLLALLRVVSNQLFALSMLVLRPALTDGVFDTLQCILYCHMADDASFNKAQWEAVKSDISSQIIGVAGSFINNLVNTLGARGLTNIVRAGGATEGDCSTCHCDDTWCYTFDFTTASWDEYFSSYNPDSNPAVYNTVYVTDEGWRTVNASPNYSMIKVAFADLPGLRRLEFTAIDSDDFMIVGELNTATGDSVASSFPSNARDFDGTETTSYIFFGRRSVATITSCTVSGVGSNPIGSNNC